MSRKYKFSDPEGMYFVTCTIVAWIDIFTRFEYRNIIIDSLKHCQRKKGLVIHAYCIMTNHIHLIISRKGKDGFADIMRDFKKYTSVKLIQMIKEINESRREWMLQIFKDAGSQNSNNENYQVWQQHNHPIILDTNKIIDQRLDYLHNNPVRAGFVGSPEEYLYSSAGIYVELDGHLEVELIQRF